MLTIRRRLLFWKLTRVFGAGTNRTSPFGINQPFEIEDEAV